MILTSEIMRISLKKKKKECSVLQYGIDIPGFYSFSKQLKDI